MNRISKSGRKGRLRILLLALALLGLPAIAGGPALGASPASSDVLADFEGLTLPPEFFAFAGGISVVTTPITVADSDALARPAQVGDNGVLQVDYNVVDFGGFGQAFVAAGAQDWSNYTSFDFWFYGTGSGLTYQAEISDNRSDPAIDTSERFDYEFTDTTAGWQYISIPFADFTRATDFQPGGAPDDGFTLTEIWAWAIVLPLGADTIYFDDVGLGRNVIDDFESGLPFGGAPCPADALPLGFCTFSGGSPVSLANPTTPPAPVLPAAGTPNSVLQLNVDASAFAGFIHGFSNPPALDTWIPQDWSTSEGISFWMYGLNTGNQLFIDILDNRNPGSTADDAERFTVPFVDDFTGWRQLEFPFSSFVRKEIGNGAPNDGLGLFEMHGYALGTLDTGGPRIYYFDDVSLYGVAEPPAPAVNFSQQNTFVEEGTTGDIGVKLNRPLGPDDPAQVSIDFATERSNAIAGEEYTPTSGTLTFVNGGATELFFPVETFDDTKFEGDEQIVIRLTNPVDVERGALFQGSVLIDDNDEFDPKLLDDFEQGAFLWDTAGPVVLDAVRTESSDATARPGQDAVENVGVAAVPRSVDIDVEGNLCGGANGAVPVNLLSTATFDATTVDHTTVMFGGATETHVDKKTGEAKRHVEDVNKDGLDDLVFHFRRGDVGLCGASVLPFNGFTFDGQPVTAGGSDAALVHDFPLGQDWTGTETLDFWYYGAGGGEEIAVTLKDNRAADPGPSGWTLAWADEFDDPAGTQPNPANWAYEIGDTTPDGKNGWGNEELQYYTDDPANAATDGLGNLVITLDEADGSQECYYGPCEFESARLLTQNKAEFAYGRIESRLKVPTGGDGLWPAFWSLGTDITYNPWPGAGEIDVMEYVSRIPTEIFGTIHGPGYSGGGSFGGTWDFGVPVYNEYHTFTVEWEPNLITWYVDGIPYHQAEPSDVPGPWVFEKPFFLLLNFAIGGNFGGAIDPANTYPQEYLVDYVRVYQGPDTAERFETTFIDDVAGWTEVLIPMTDFVRSADQPAGAPNDGLDLDEVWGYSLGFPNGTASGEARIDFVRRVPIPPPTDLVVINLDDSGPGSLREALALIADGGTITFDPSLAGGTVDLLAPITLRRDVTIDASGVPGVSLDGLGADRVLIVDAGATASVSNLTMANGFGFQLAGCVLNNGNLTLDQVTVTGCLMTTDAGDFWQGGGGIYNGDGATLNLVDSTVLNNTAQWSGGGVYSFFNTTTTVVRSTISGNVSNDVGGALRLLGNAEIVNSTISGNTSTGWHGGAIFQTDGDVSILNSTIADNVAPDYAASALFIGQFGGGFVPTLTLTNTIITGNQWYACEKFASGTVGNVVSGGHNVVQDDSCNPAASDQVISDALIGSLADNGGPTLTHALLPGSPAIDAADAVVCPATDQRGALRDAACDVGSYEFGAVVP